MSTYRNRLLGDVDRSQTSRRMLGHEGPVNGPSIFVAVSFYLNDDRSTHWSRFTPIGPVDRLVRPRRRPKFSTLISSELWHGPALRSAS